jgi:hypothetical protein
MIALYNNTNYFTLPPLILSNPSLLPLTLSPMLLIRKN